MCSDWEDYEDGFWWGNQEGFDKAIKAMRRKLNREARFGHDVSLPRKLLNQVVREFKNDQQS